MNTHVRAMSEAICFCLHKKSVANFNSMVVTRTISNFSKIHTFLICRMQKWKKIGSSLDMDNNLKVAFFGQILSNIHFYIW